MKKVQFNIHYRTVIGESLFIKIKELETGRYEEELDYVYDSIWRFDKEIKEGDAEYHFLVKDVAGRILNEEMNGHLLVHIPHLIAIVFSIHGTIKFS
jgi:4-alpha-glucanotransferase